MYFKQINEIVSGAKTQTRRVYQMGQFATDADDVTAITITGTVDIGEQIHSVYHPSEVLKWQVGRDYAVSPGRGKPGVWVNAKGHVVVPAKAASKLGSIALLPMTDQWLIDHYYTPLRIRITEIRREPLQDITEADAIAEGYPYADTEHLRDTVFPPVIWYRDLWKHINGPKSWDANPDVWVLTFEVVKS